jgi:hypothetical protein
VVSPRDVRELDETLDVAQTIRGKFDLLAKRTEKETKKRAEAVVVHFDAVIAETRGLKDHIERNEDIA